MQLREQVSVFISGDCSIRVLLTPSLIYGCFIRDDCYIRVQYGFVVQFMSYTIDNIYGYAQAARVLMGSYQREREIKRELCLHERESRHEIESPHEKESCREKRSRRERESSLD